MSTAQTTDTAPKASLCDRCTDKALAHVDELLKGDQRMAGAEGPAQSHPEAVQALYRAAEPNSHSAVAAVESWWSLTGMLSVVAPFLRKILEPLIRAAIADLIAEIQKLLVVPVQADVASIRVSHPDVNVSRSEAAIAAFYDENPELPRPAPPNATRAEVKGEVTTTPATASVANGGLTADVKLGPTS